MPRLPRWFWPALAALIAAHVLLQVHLAREDSQTNDEAAHLVAGYSYWILHDWRLNPEHPPLSKLAAALPLLALPLDFPRDPPAWRGADEFALGREFLYQNRLPAGTILLAARGGTILFSGLLVATVGLWCGARFGACPALVATGLAAFDPTLLAHGHYVTSDVPVAFFYFAATLSWCSWLESGGRRRLLASALLAGLALATKFSALLLVPTFALLWVWKRRPLDRIGAAELALLPALVVWASYGFDIRPVTADPRIGTALAASPLAHMPIPAYYFFRGLHLLARHAHGGHVAYLLGRISPHGFLWYFPVVFLVKSTLGLLLITAGAVAVLVRARRAALLLAVPPLLYFATSMAVGIDIGVRHILPVYPFLYALAAAAVSASGATVYRRPARIAAALCVMAAAAESLAAYPFVLGFFNFAAGGPRRGIHYLADSNLDWGQDLKRLRVFLETNRIEHPCLAYFGEADPAYYGIRAAPLAPFRAPADLAKQNCAAIVSAQILYAAPTHPFAALKSRRPDAVVGTSLFVFRPPPSSGIRPAGNQGKAPNCKDGSN